ncbi:MAG: methylenetetrahydrofolate reductase [Gammaproteobacteria bacterium]|jgi:methylenetetrahydrofolate reductase (NADPH)|nr:methylenetetrahydrofolate reductase [Gammaproteobacteria bacterium]
MESGIAERSATDLRNLLRNYSAEVTSGDRKSIDAAKRMMQPGAEIFIASPPSDPVDRQIAVAAELKRAGLTPVPHVVARNIKNLGDLDLLLGRLRDAAGVDRVLILAGDRDRPVGDFGSSVQILESGLLGKHGIRKIALSWYPEGHPRIPAADLVAARAAKLAAAAEADLDVTLISQFCFESAPIIAMAKQIRAEGVRVPLRVGVAGPASHAALLKYAMICGVGASIRALKERRGMLAGGTPEDLLVEIALAQAADPALRIQGVHFFTFASLAGTVGFVEELRRSAAFA